MVLHVTKLGKLKLALFAVENLVHAVGVFVDLLHHDVVPLVHNDGLRSALLFDF